MPRVFVSIGSNIDRERNIQGALEALTQRFGPLAVSTIYETAAVGFDGQPFYNLVVAFDSDESVDAIRAELRRIEDAHGRQRNGVPKFSSRTLDLDLLLCGDVVDPVANLPHPDILNYAFVLGPLAELAPELLHPASGDALLVLWRKRFPGGGGLRPVTIRR